MAKQVSIKLNIPVQVVVLAYSSFWENIKESIKESNLDLVDENTEIDFPLSYNIGSIGKLYTHKNRIVAINNNIKNSKERNENTEY